MMAAADLEDRTEKAAVTPGPLAPARELLGEMLLQMGKPTEALEAFEATLKKEPNRFRALSGAIRRRRWRPDGQGTPARPDPAEDVCQGGRVGAAGTRRSEEARLVRVAVRVGLAGRGGCGIKPTRTVSAGDSCAPAATTSARAARQGGWRS